MNGLRVQDILPYLHRYWMDACPTDIIWNLSDTGWAKAAYGNLFGPWNQGACVFIENMGPKFNAKRTLEVNKFTKQINQCILVQGLI